MQPIPETFVRDGYTSQLIKRAGLVTLWERAKPGVKPHYEVAVLSVHPAHTWPDGRTVPERESMPPNEAWGLEAWTYGDIASAERRFLSPRIARHAI